MLLNLMPMLTYVICTLTYPNNIDESLNKAANDKRVVLTQYYQ